MQYLITFSVLVVLAYIYMLAQFYRGWKSLSFFSASEEEAMFPISVIVPFRNEEENLPSLLLALSAQTYPYLEIILVNDHSTDSSSDIVKKFQQNIPFLKLVDAKGEGKKNALKEGIARSTGDFIVCTDADCIPGNDWIKTIASYQAEHYCDMLICPVKIADGQSVFQKLQALEFTTLIASGAGAAGIKKPIMCNGANLGFSRLAWERSVDELKENEPSGDDMFLMMSIKKRNGRIHFLKKEEAIVETVACETIPEFINQRKRWVSKSKSYSDFQVMAVGLEVMIVNLLILGYLSYGFIYPIAFKAAILIWLVKTLSDMLFLSKTLDFFGQKSLILLMPLFSVLYPLYVLISGFLGLFGSYTWKDRRY